MSPVRANRLNDVVNCILKSGGVGATRKEIADCLQIKVTPYLNQLCDQVVAEGYATKEMDYNVYPGAWRYYPTDKLRSIA